MLNMNKLMMIKQIFDKYLKVCMYVASGMDEHIGIACSMDSL